MATATGGFDIDVEQYIRDSEERAEQLIVAFIVDMTGTIIELARGEDGIIDTGNWKGSWYIEKGDVAPQKAETGNASRDSHAAIISQISGYELGDVWTVYNATSYAVPLEFMDGSTPSGRTSPHAHKVRDTLSTAPSVIGETARRFAR